MSVFLYGIHNSVCSKDLGTLVLYIYICVYIYIYIYI